MLDATTRNLFSTYPRFFGAPKRWKVFTQQQLEREFELNNGINPCFISLYDLNYVLDKIWLELDASSIERALVEALKLTSRLIEMKIEFYVLFSGSKGFHFYIPIEKVKLDSQNAKLVLKQAQQKLVEGIDKVDTSGHGDINRMVRMPCSINQKTNHYCTYLPNDFINWSALQIVRYSEEPHMVNIINTTTKLETILEKPLTEIKPIHRENFGQVTDFSYSLPDTNISKFLKPLIRPCVLSQALDAECPHEMRTTFCSELMHLGFTVDDIVKIMSQCGWSDYNEGTTKYHVKRIFEMNVKPMGCQRLIELYNCKCPGWDQYWYRKT